jgi:hypothetical protein
MINSLTGYCEFFFTEDEAIDHCRRQNAGLKPGDENCYAVIDGPGCATEEHPYLSNPPEDENTNRTRLNEGTKTWFAEGE